MPGTSVLLSTAEGLISDSAGNVYFTSTPQNMVFKLDGTGLLTRVAGTGVPGFAGDGGPAVDAQLNQPIGLALDGSGNLYIADSSNNRVREVSASGNITTLAGSGNCCTLGDGGIAASAWLYGPTGVAIDASGNIYISDQYNQRVRMVNPGGTISTLAGNGTGGYSGDGGQATSAMLSYPTGIAVDASGNVYIADTNNSRIRKVSGGLITTFAGNGSPGYSGDGVQATRTELSYPRGVMVAPSGNVFIADSSSGRIREVSSGGVISTVAGGNCCSLGDGGSATAAWLNWPNAMGVDGAGNLYIADSNNLRIREVSTIGFISTIAGGGNGGDNGPAPFASFASPQAMVADGFGNIYVADSTGNRVREISAGGAITTVAGNGLSGFSGDGGPATSASLSTPSGLAVDTSGNLYIADSGNQRIRKVSTAGTISTFAGTYYGYSGDGGPATSAALAYPRGIAFDSMGDLYIADSNNSRIRKVWTSGIITTVAGNGSSGFSGDGGAAVSVELNNPQAVALDHNGNLYIADSSNYRIREVGTNGNINTVAGTGTYGYSGDGGPATGAQIMYPIALLVNGAGNLYFADGNNNRIRVVSANGNIDTAAGNGSSGYTGDGGEGVLAALNNPSGLAIDGSGRIYIADSNNRAIRTLIPPLGEAALSVQGTHSGSFAAGESGATYVVTASNSALAGATSGTVTVTETLPLGLTLVGMAGTGWNCGSGSCSRSDSLAPGGAYPPITVTVNVASTTPSQLSNSVLVSGGGSLSSAAVDVTAVSSYAPQAALSVAISYTGTFSQGETGATYIVTVSNAAGVGPSSGTVSVTETMPAGLSLVSMAGSGWTCGGNTCTRSDPLAPGASYPAITVTVNVAGNAPASLTNQATVQGGASLPASNTDITAIIPVITPCNISNDTAVNIVDVQLIIAEALGARAPVHDLNTDGVVNVVDVMIVLDAALGYVCSAK